MKKFKITFYYLASGMNGIADTRDYGIIESDSKENAIKQLSIKEYPRNVSNRNWFKSCLTATEISQC